MYRHPKHWPRMSCMDPEGGQGVNFGPDPLENHIDTKPAFNVGPLLVCQRNAISLADRRWPTFSGMWILSPLVN